MKKSSVVYSVLIHCILIVGAAVMIVPFLWMILTSFKSISESTQLNPFIIFPSVWRTDAFFSVLTKMKVML